MKTKIFYSILAVIILMASSCQGQEREYAEVYFQAAYPTQGCRGLSPSYVVIDIGKGVGWVVDVKEINSGVRSETFPMEFGETEIVKIEVFNEQGDLTHYVMPEELADQETGMFTPFTQKVNQQTVMIAGQLWCH